MNSFSVTSGTKSLKSLALGTGLILAIGAGLVGCAAPVEPSPDPAPTVAAPPVVPPVMEGETGLTEVTPEVTAAFGELPYAFEVGTLADNVLTVTFTKGDVPTLQAWVKAKISEGWIIPQEIADGSNYIAVLMNDDKTITVDLSGTPEAPFTALTYTVKSATEETPALPDAPTESLPEATE